MLGAAAILLACYLLSANRKAIQWRVIAWGIGLQLILAAFVLRTDFGFRLLDALSRGIMWLIHFSFEGSRFVFGNLGDPNGGYGILFAFQILPIIIFVAALFSVLYYLRVIPVLIGLGAKLMFRLMRTSGAESLEVCASIVIDQTSAPLVIKPYLPGLTQSELLTIMTAGMAHISGSMLAAYALLGADPRHLLTAVVMTAPGTILISKMLLPETGTPVTASGAPAILEDRSTNFLSAIASGTGDGLQLALTVAAMLIVFVSLIALANGILGAGHTSLQSVFGYVLSPIAWLLGVPWKDARVVGSLMATKLVLNEFIAFSMLGPLKGQISPRSFVIATYALCGFSNFGSIGIQIGAIGTLAPNRRSDLARLGLRALLAATLANYLSASIIGWFMS
jgi:concentrative nucleoside transporter, CNT family